MDIDTDVSQASMPDMPRPIIHDDGEIPGSMPLRRGDEDISQVHKFFQMFLKLTVDY